MSRIERDRAPSLNIAFFGSSLVSAYWNGAATYYRGIIKALHDRGHRITFYEPNAFGRQEHRDIDEPSWADVVVYHPSQHEALRQVEAARRADVIVKASGVGINDELLERAIPNLASARSTTVFWDVDAPATLASMEADPGHHLRKLIPIFDMVLTYGGGNPIVTRYRCLGARDCIPIYNALDPESHYPTMPEGRFACDLAFLGNRLPDRESRVEEFFFRAAELAPQRAFILGGSGWEDRPLPPNVRNLGHVYTADHNAFNCTPLAVLNISRESMAASGYSPATRLFEVAGAGACLITDAWRGIELFLTPNEEVLVATNADDVVGHLDGLTFERARQIGRRARQRILNEHTYDRRAAEVESVLTGARAFVEPGVMTA